jgi:hypothetical protein
MHTFLPARTDDIGWNNLQLLQSHSKVSPTSFSALKSVLLTYRKPTLLLLSGYENFSLNMPDKASVIVGALIRNPWTDIESVARTINPNETKFWNTTLFQLAPVHRVYSTRKEKLNPFPVLQRNGIGIGRELVDDSTIESVGMGTTSLMVNAELDTAVFEHGKSDSSNGAFEGFCNFGVGKEGLLKMDVRALEVWGC